MADQSTISSNATSLYKARETVPGQLPESAQWFEKEPNEYGDFGASYEKVGRQPINSSRQVSKQNTVGYDATASFTSDLTPISSEADIEEFCFALARRKLEFVVQAATETGFTVAADADDLLPGALIFVSGFVNPANNGLHIVGNNATPTEIAVAAAVPETISGMAKAVQVGHQFAAGDASIAIVNGRPALVSNSLNMTGFQIIPGEILYVGGDEAAHNFADDKNAGYCRVFTVTEDHLVFDKTDKAMVADPGTGKTVRMFFGRVVKNEQAALQKMLTCAFRRQLGSPDTDNPEALQSQVILGCTANELTLTLPEQDKLTYEVSYLGRSEQLYDNDAAVDANGDLVPVEESDAFNSTRDLIRYQWHVIAPNKALIPLFAAFTEGELTINNNNSANKALTFFGTYNVTPGTFEVGGSATAYFTKVEELRAVKDNKDITCFAMMFRENRGVAYDLPLFDISTDGLEVELNAAVMMPIDTMASRGRKYSKEMDHTILFVFFDYLPSSASV